MPLLEQENVPVPKVSILVHYMWYFQGLLIFYSAHAGMDLAELLILKHQDEIMMPVCAGMETLRLFDSSYWAFVSKLMSLINKFLKCFYSLWRIITYLKNIFHKLHPGLQYNFIFPGPSHVLMFHGSGGRQTTFQAKKYQMPQHWQQSKIT